MSLDACLTGREGQGAGVQEPQPGQHCVVATEVPEHGETSSFIYAFSAASVNIPCLQLVSALLRDTTESVKGFIFYPIYGDEQDGRM